jgi:ABC-type glycerol-3-phosphate transport system substrate-binding protein
MTASADAAAAAVTDAPYPVSFDEALDQVGLLGDYAAFTAGHTYSPKPERTVTIEAASYTEHSFGGPAEYESYMGQEGISVYTDEEGHITWEVYIEEEGLYNISVLYYPVLGKSSDIQRAVFINGVIPFSEAGIIEFSRIWTNEAMEITRDTQGNDLKPRQIESPSWQNAPFTDTQGYHSAPLQFYFNKGINTLTLVSLREPMLIRSVSLYREPELPPYAEVLARYDLGGYRRSSGYIERIEAESAEYKSSPMLYPVSDHSSPAVLPYDAREIRNNMIGGERWDIRGQWIEWEITVPESGLYKIGLHFLQNVNRGAISYRRLYINGKTPFKEAEKLGFAFHKTWRFEYLGDGRQPYLFYLNEGVNTLRLEAVLGEYAQLAMEIETLVKDLNRLYREVTMIISVSPDRYRDYQLQVKMPELEGLTGYYSDRLYAIYDSLTAITGERSSRDAAVRTMAYQLEVLSRDVERFTSRIQIFKSTIGALGTWLMQVKQQPLGLDAVFIASEDADPPAINNSFWARMIHAIRKLYYSFIIDYNAIGNVSADRNQTTIEVWIGTGRDQAVSIKAMIDDDFTKNEGINVNLMLVQMETLLSATLAGQGPDVAMQVANDLPMNYGMRGAVMDIAVFEDFSEVIKQFNESAMIPYIFSGRCFALPETQSFPMLFYRKDVLHEIGMGIPQTWDDVKASLSILNKHNLAFGLHPEGSYPIFLLQSGGEFYRDEGRFSDLDSDIAINAFREYTKYFTDYKLDLVFDFVNRFRTGEMPIGVIDYTAYNMLQVAAPEIRGLWDFTLIPGTPDQDGNIRRDTPSNGSAVVIMENTKNAPASWEFIKWWTSAETQVRFGREMEALMGAAARYPTANMDALESLPWPTRDFKLLKEQFAYARGIPQVPGGYFTDRGIRNAFTSVVVDQNIGPREALTDHVHFINEEIASKRREFGLD